MSVPGVCTKSDASTCTSPAEPAPRPAPSTPATVTGAAPALVAFPAADGGERLLPGYAFTLAAGGTRTVLAVDAGVLFTGLDEAQAATEAARQGWAYRVVARDGHDLLVTQDYSPARVSVSVTGGKVDKATFG